jgi:hypothetical protein
MKCIVNDGRDAVTIIDINRYCYEHYQIYDSLQKLYQQVVKSNGPLTWNDYLKKVLDAQFNAPWKTSVVDTSGRTLDIVARVGRAELGQERT